MALKVPKVNFLGRGCLSRFRRHHLRLYHAPSVLTKLVTVSDRRNLGPVFPRLYAGAHAKLCILPLLVSLLLLRFCNSFLLIAMGLPMLFFPVLYLFSPVTIGMGSM